MFSKSTILVLLAIVALAVASSELGALPARHRERRQVPSDQRAVTWPHTTALATSLNWAGAVWSQETNTFKTVTGTFTVPSPQSNAYGRGAIWVGIDGNTCKSAILQTGVDFTFNGGQGSYQAWYEWFPENPINFDPGIAINAGDSIRLTVTATSSVAGTVLVENLTTRMQATESVTSSTPLCLQDAEWIVESIKSRSGYSTLGNYGSVTFAAAHATGFNDVIYMPDGASLICRMKQGNIVLATAFANGDSVTIRYANIAVCM